MNHFLRSSVLMLTFAFSISTGVAQNTQKQTLITNVHVFDGKSEKLIMSANVLVEGNHIKQVSSKPISAKQATVIDGGGRILMPGMIEAHGHVTYA